MLRNGLDILNKSRFGVGAEKVPGNRLKNRNPALTINGTVVLTIQYNGP